MKFVYEPSISKYDFGPSHPFRGDRFPSFVDFLRKRREPFEIVGYTGPAPSWDDLMAVHDEGYLNFLKTLSKTGYGLISLDTPAFKGMWEAALSIVHSSLSAIRIAIREGSAAGFGGAHHAGINVGGGFCLINDVAVVTKWAQRNGLDSVAIFDHDAHHGNGTMEIFFDDDTVLYISVHQDPTTIYPGVGFARQIGRGKGEGFTVNIPLPPKAGPISYRMAFEEVIKPVTDSFDADLSIAHGGSDPHFLDPLTDLGQTLNGLWEIGKWASLIRARYRVELLISGYNSDIRNWGWLSLLRGFSGLDIGFNPMEVEGNPPKERDYVLRRARLVVEEVKRVLSRYWRLA